MILDAYPDLNNNTIRWLGLTLYLHNIAIDISLPAWNQQHLWTLSTLMETSNPPLLRSGCGRNLFHEMKFGTECGEHLNTLKDIHHILVQIQISNVEATYMTLLNISQHWGPPISWVTWTSTLMEVFGHKAYILGTTQRR